MKTYQKAGSLVLVMAGLLATSVFAGDEGAKTSQTADTIEIVRGNWSKSPNEMVLKEGSIKLQIPKYNCDYQDPIWSQAFLAGVSSNDLKLSFQMRIDEFQKTSFLYAPDHWGRRNYPYLYQFSSAVYVGYENEMNYWQILFSPQFNEIAIFNPSTGIVRAVPADLPSGKSLPVEIVVNPMRIVIRLDGKTLIDFVPEHGKIDSGKAGFGGYCSSVGFSDIRLDTPGKLAIVPASAHHPEFRLRDWLGNPWVFDKDEPVAKIIPGGMQDDGFDKYSVIALTQVKLRPGTPPVVPIPLGWEIMSKVAEKDQVIGIDSKFEVESAANGDLGIVLHVGNDKTFMHGKIRAIFHYDPTSDNYVIDISYFEMPAGRQSPVDIRLGTIWAYNVVGPSASRSSPSSWRREYDHAFSMNPDGTQIYPLNHSILVMKNFSNAEYPAAKFPLGKGVLQMYGYLGTDGGHGSTVKEILVGTGKMGFCNWIYDYSGPTMSLPPIQAETCFHRYQIRLLGKDEETALREQISHSKVKEDFEVALFEPSGTSFADDAWRMLSTPFDRNPFLPQGKYVHDKTTGRNDSHSLMLKPENSVIIEVLGGAAFWGEIWTDADNLTAEVWVKTDEIDGKGVRMVLKDITNKKTYESSFVNRASEWQRLSIPLPGDIKLFHLQIEKDGKGKAWIDDISIQKTNNANKSEKQ